MKKFYLFVALLLTAFTAFSQASTLGRSGDNSSYVLLQVNGDMGTPQVADPLTDGTQGLSDTNVLAKQGTASNHEAGKGNPDDGPTLAQRNFETSLVSNPVQSVINIQLTVKAETDVTVSVNDLNGRELCDLGSFHCVAGTQMFSMKAHKLSKGFYVLEVRNHSGEQTILFNVGR
jgi:hypothetical protein